MNYKVNKKLLSVILLVILFAAGSGVYYLTIPWKLDGKWVSGPNDGFGLMPTKKQFLIEFREKDYKFQGNVRPVQEYQYDLENQMVKLVIGKNITKIRIVDDNTIRFNEGSRGVGLRIYRRTD